MKALKEKRLTVCPYWHNCYLDDDVKKAVLSFQREIKEYRENDLPKDFMLNIFKKHFGDFEV